MDAMNNDSHRASAQKGASMAHQYGLATGLKGFGPISTLRVRILEARDGVVFVVTADLADAGTRLVLNPSQVEPEPSAAEPSVHATGLVALG